MAACATTFANSNSAGMPVVMARMLFSLHVAGCEK